MPDVMKGLASQRKTTARALASYLRSFATPQDGEGEAGDSAGHEDAARDDDARARGRELYGSVGCVACHAARGANGLAMDIGPAAPLGDLAAKYSAGSLARFLLDPLAARPDGRMPDMQLSPQEAHDIATFLLAGAKSGGGAAEDASTGEDALVDLGRQAFAELLCARCHELPDPERDDDPARFASLETADFDKEGACTGSSPHVDFDLSDEQRAQLRAALGALSDFGDEAHVSAALVARNCIACHERDGLGGISDARERFFTSSDPAVGHEGRFPPHLRRVGAKLQPKWLEAVVAHGTRVRPYLNTRMPGFGPEIAAELRARFERVDPKFEGAPKSLPKDRKKAEPITKLGRELVGDKGMNCISCHRFAGQRSETMGALDLVAWTKERLRPEWFVQYLRDPFAFKPNTLMPQFYPDGKSIRPELGGGDPERQIAAMWHYLASGRNVRKPPGMRRKAITIAVDHEAVMLRRSLQDASKRAISVAYPRRDGVAEGVNLGFDAETLGLEQLWWGEFLDASPVWTGQGSGRARILSKQRARLARGPGFSQAAAGETWPEDRRALGQRWLGYELDEARRPSFRYALDPSVLVVDTPREFVTVDGRDGLRRVLRMRANAGASVDRYRFRAARAKRIVEVEPGRFRVDDKFEIKLVGGGADAQLSAFDKQQELRLDISLEAGGESRVTLEYTWLQKGGK